MKNRLLGEKILTILKYSGVAPFNMDRTFTINKNLLHVNRLVIVMAFLIQFPASKPFTFFFEKPSLTTFGPAISTALYGGAVFSIILITYLNLDGICGLINKIMSCKEKLILMLGKNIQREKIHLAHLLFIIIQACSFFFCADNIITNLTGFDPAVGITTSFLGYYVACYDFFYIVLVLNVYHLFKALNGNIRAAIERQKEAYDEECNEKKEMEIKLEVFKLIKELYSECNKILNIVDGIDKCFAKVNLLSLSNNAMATVFTAFFCFSDSNESRNADRMILLTYFGSFFVAKSAFVLYFSWITTLKVKLLNIFVIERTNFVNSLLSLFPFANQVRCNLQTLLTFNLHASAFSAKSINTTFILLQVLFFIIQIFRLMFSQKMMNFQLFQLFNKVLYKFFIAFHNHDQVAMICLLIMPNFMPPHSSCLRKSLHQHETNLEFIYLSADCIFFYPAIIYL